MANQWLRLWHDMPNDPKWRTIARLSKQPIADVMAVYLHLLVSASLADDRGELSINEEDLASALDSQPQDIQAILKAMQGRVIENNKLKGWDKRQPIKEDGSAGRAKAWREAKKELAKQTNASERPEKEADKDKEIISLSNVKENGELQQFAMYENWQPNEHFINHLSRMGISDYQGMPDGVLKEFVCFWMTKPSIEKTQDQWHHALAQSYQYVLYREKSYGKSKKSNRKTIRSITETATDTNWW